MRVLQQVSLSKSRPAHAASSFMRIGVQHPLPLTAACLSRMTWMFRFLSTQTPSTKAVLSKIRSPHSRAEPFTRFTLKGRAADTPQTSLKSAANQTSFHLLQLQRDHTPQILLTRPSIW